MKQRKKILTIFLLTLVFTLVFGSISISATAVSLQSAKDVCGFSSFLSMLVDYSVITSEFANQLTDLDEWNDKQTEAVKNALEREYGDSYKNLTDEDLKALGMSSASIERLHELYEDWGAQDEENWDPYSLSKLVTENSRLIGELLGASGVKKTGDYYSQPVSISGYNFGQLCSKDFYDNVNQVLYNARSWKPGSGFGYYFDCIDTDALAINYNKVINSAKQYGYEHIYVLFLGYQGSYYNMGVGSKEAELMNNGFISAYSHFTNRDGTYFTIPSTYVIATNGDITVSVLRHPTKTDYAAYVINVSSAFCSTYNSKIGEATPGYLFENENVYVNSDSSDSLYFPFVYSNDEEVRLLRLAEIENIDWSLGGEALQPLSIPVPWDTVLNLGAAIGGIGSTLTPEDIAKAGAMAEPGAVTLPGTAINVATPETMTKDVVIDMSPVKDISKYLSSPVSDTKELDFSPLYVSFKDKFPFCIPFDFYNCFSMFKADAVCPILTIKVSEWGSIFKDMPDIILDFSEWDGFIKVFRSISLIGFVITLVLGTKKLIWG